MFFASKMAFILRANGVHFGNVFREHNGVHDGGGDGFRNHRGSNDCRLMQADRVVLASAHAVGKASIPREALRGGI